MSLSGVYQLGFKSGYNPCAITTLLVLLIALFSISKNKTEVTLSVIFSALYLVLLRSLVVFGMFDRISLEVMRPQGLALIYLVIAVAFLIVGIKHFVDCRKLRQGTLLSGKILPEILKWRDAPLKQKGVFLRVLRLAATYFGLVLLLLLLESVWMHDYYMFVVFIKITSEVSWHQAILSVLKYGFASTWLFIIASIVLIYILNSKKRVESIISNYSLYKILTAGLYISTGVGLGITFIRKMLV